METMLPKGNKSISHQQMRSYSQDLLRRNVIEAASQLLVQEGAEALTVRRVAEVLQCSTKIVYTMFHGKDGLANALYIEGCTLLHAVVSQVPVVTDPALYLENAAQAYWEFALKNPSYYLTMFCGAIPNFEPDVNSMQTAESAFEQMVKSLQVYMEQGLFPKGDATTAAKILWSSIHGVVSLYLQGHLHSLEMAQEIFEHTRKAMIASFLPLSATA